MSLHFALRSLVIMSFLLTTMAVADSKTEIPSWIKNNAKWWADGMISDSDFAHSKFSHESTGVIGVTQVYLSTHAGREHFAFERVIERQDGTLALCQVMGKLNGQIKAKASCRPLESVSEAALSQSTVPFDQVVNTAVSGALEGY